MITINTEKDIKMFINYYQIVEKPHRSIINLFSDIIKKRLLDKIEVVYDKNVELTEATILIYPNGRVIWKDRTCENQSFQYLLSFIESSSLNQKIILSLYSKEIEEQEEINKRAMTSVITIDEYEQQIKRIEEKEQEKRNRYLNWMKEYDELKNKRMNSILDRYNIQKEMYEYFSDEKYKRKMDKWEDVFYRMME